MTSKRHFEIVFILLLIGNLNQAFSQASEKIRQDLKSLGFENIRMIHQNGKLTICAENISYRWQVNAIAKMLGTIADSLNETVDLEVVLLENDIPQLLLEVKSADWENFWNRNMPTEEFWSHFKVTVNTHEEWQKLKKLKAGNKTFGKIDLVFYPQFAYKNTLLAKLYEVQLNLAPAIEMPLGHGFHFTGQIIFPIINELGYEGNFIRPGYVTLTKDFRLPGKVWGKFSFGNFNATRYGADFWVKRFLSNENWSVELNAGLTGSSHFFDSKWIRSTPNTFTWVTSVSHFTPRYNLRLKLSAARYIYGDYGLMASCTRFFGETAFGFYAMLGENNVNGGFHLSVPFPFRERGRRNYFRLAIPTHFEMSYDAGTEFLNNQSYGISPSGNRIYDNKYPNYIRNELIHLKK